MISDDTAEDFTFDELPPRAKMYAELNAAKNEVEREAVVVRYEALGVRVREIIDDEIAELLREYDLQPGTGNNA